MVLVSWFIVACLFWHWEWAADSVWVLLRVVWFADFMLLLSVGRLVCFNVWLGGLFLLVDSVDLLMVVL